MARARITSIGIRNYKSIGFANVRFEPLTILVGRNGAGKSNVRDALAIVADALQSTLEFSIRQRGGIGEVRRQSAGHPTHFTISIRLSLGDLSGGYAFTIGAEKAGGFSVDRERACAGLAFFETKKGKIVDRSDHLTAAPQVAPDRLLLSAVSAVPEFRGLFDALAGMRFYNIDPNSFRQPQPHDAGDVLLPTGGNIASVIRRMRQDDPESLDRIQDFIRAVVPGLERIESTSIATSETLVFAQRMQSGNRPRRFYASAMSDGTLRSLGVLAALFQTHPRLGSPSLVAIEEPESTIHPGAAGVLMDALIEASQRHQVLATTHSPDLLDNPKLPLDSVRIVESCDGETTIAEADEASKQAVRDNLFTPGELLRQSQISAEPSSARPRQIDLFKLS